MLDLNLKWVCDLINFLSLFLIRRFVVINNILKTIFSLLSWYLMFLQFRTVERKWKMEPHRPYSADSPLFMTQAYHLHCFASENGAIILTERLRVSHEGSVTKLFMALWSIDTPYY